MASLLGARSIRRNSSSRRGSNLVDLFGTEVEPVVALMFIGEIAIMAVFVGAWALARLHRGKHHHYVMWAAFLTDMLLFKPLMMARALEAYGPYPWPGTGILLHFVLDAGVVAVGVSSILTAYKFRVKKNGKMFLPRKGRVHRLLGYLFILLWTATFIGGIRIFAWAYLG